jgi:hypothetical protein
MPTIAGRLIPMVEVANQDYALLVPSLTALPMADLRQAVASLAADLERILADLDYSFIGF